MNTIEAQVADALLQRAKTIQIGDKGYSVAPPSIATLVLVSEAVAKLPHVKLDDTDVVRESLSVAKECIALGDIAAILILGAKGITRIEQRPQIKRKRLLGGLIQYNKTEMREVVIDAKTELSKDILENMSPAQLHGLITQLLASMDLADFFAVTTFLTEINLLRQTKVESATTAFGQ